MPRRALWGAIRLIDSPSGESRPPPSGGLAQHPAWLSYVGAPDVDASTKKAESQLALALLRPASTGRRIRRRMKPGSPAVLHEVGISVDFGIFKLDTKWVGDPRQRDAAWALYMELVTRVATQGLDLDGGLLREALDSLHSLFAVTREVLRGAGPVAGVSDQAVGGIAVMVLNKGIRPFLAVASGALPLGGSLAATCLNLGCEPVPDAHGRYAEAGKADPRWRARAPRANPLRERLLRRSVRSAVHDEQLVPKRAGDGAAAGERAPEDRRKSIEQ